MRKILYFLLFDNDIRIVKFRLKRKKWFEINLVNRFTFDKRLLTILIAKVLIKFIFIIE